MSIKWKRICICWRSIRMPSKRNWICIYRFTLWIGIRISMWMRTLGWMWTLNRMWYISWTCLRVPRLNRMFWSRRNWMWSNNLSTWNLMRSMSSRSLMWRMWRNWVSTINWMWRVCRNSLWSYRMSSINRMWRIWNRMSTLNSMWGMCGNRMSPWDRMWRMCWNRMWSNRMFSISWM